MGAGLSSEGSDQVFCVLCGCSREFNEHGDRVCWCDVCMAQGCVHTQLGASDSPAHELQAHQRQDADLARYCDHTKWQMDNSSSQGRAEACNEEGVTAGKAGER